MAIALSHVRFQRQSGRGADVQAWPLPTHFGSAIRKEASRAKRGSRLHFALCWSRL